MNPIRAGYAEFIADGLKTRSGIKLSRGGKQTSRALNPTLSEEAVFDERILGGGRFVESLLERDVLQSDPEGTGIHQVDPAGRQLFQNGPGRFETVRKNSQPGAGKIRYLLCGCPTFGAQSGRCRPTIGNQVSHAIQRGAKLLSEDPVLTARLSG
jgi:hypothetical protein